MAMFGTVAAWSVLAGLLATAVTVIAKPGGIPIFSLPPGFQLDVANAYVVPAVALLGYGLAVFLFMLGLIGEFAVQRYSERSGDAPPMASEVTP